jgi:hypothetical protein
MKRTQKGSGIIRNLLTKIKNFLTRKKNIYDRKYTINTNVHYSTKRKSTNRASFRPLLLTHGYKPSRESLNKSIYRLFINDIRQSDNDDVKLFYYNLLFTLQNYFIEIDSFEKSNNKYIFIKYLLDEIRKRMHENIQNNIKNKTNSIFENYNKLLNNDIYTKIFIDELMVIMNKINSIIQIIILRDYSLIHTIKKRHENIVNKIYEYNLNNNTYEDKNKYISIINNFTDIELSVIIDRSKIFIYYITKFLLMPKTQSFEINDLNNNNRFINKRYHDKLNDFHKKIIILFLNYHVCQMKINFPLTYETQKNNTHRIKTKNTGLFLQYYSALLQLISNSKTKSTYNNLDLEDKDLLKDISNKYNEKGITNLESIEIMKLIKPSSCTQTKKEIKKYTKLLLTLPIFRKKSTIFHRLTRIN